MTFTAGFILGTVVGVNIGVLIMAVMRMAADNGGSRERTNGVTRNQTHKPDPPDRGTQAQPSWLPRSGIPIDQYYDQTNPL